MVGTPEGRGASRDALRAILKGLADREARIETPPALVRGYVNRSSPGMEVGRGAPVCHHALDGSDWDRVSLVGRSSPP